MMDKRVIEKQLTWSFPRNFFRITIQDSDTQKLTILPHFTDFPKHHKSWSV